MDADSRWMRLALEAAHLAGEAGDVPVGAVIVRGDELLATASNRTARDQDPTGHAEIQVIKEAAHKLSDWRLVGCTLFVTLEPCAMCAGAVVLSRLDRVVFGAFDDKAGMVGSVGDLLRHPKLNHQPEVLAGVLREECATVLADFFRRRR